MPLPKPPAKRASLLTAADVDSQSAPQPGKRPQKTRAAAEPTSPAVLDLFDGSGMQQAVAVKPTPVAPVIAPVVRRPAPQVRAR